jgi:flagellar biosynthesis protein
MNRPDSRPPPRKKTPRAVALRYDPFRGKAPSVSAKGSGSVARKIVEIARKHGIAIHRDADMVEILSRIDVGDEIPEYLYRAVAEILAFVYRLNREYPGHFGNNKKA